MTDQYGFLHWHLAFLDVFGGRGGFDIVLGNPPWEKVKLSEKEFFAARSPEIANLAGDKRKAAIQKLQVEDPDLWDAYVIALRQAEGESHFIRSSGRFPLCGRGDVNTYAVFAEVMRDAVVPTGRLGVIVPTGIATDDTTKHFFADCVTDRRLASLYDFENREALFPGVDSRMKFCLLTLTGLQRPVDEAEFVFFAHQTADLNDPERRFTLSPDDLALINPNTKTAPVFRSRRDAEITKAIYRRVPVLVRDGDPNGNPWGVFYLRLVDYEDHAELLEDGPRPGAVGVYESKMIHQFNHRWGDWSDSLNRSAVELPEVDVERLADPSYKVASRHWIDDSSFQEMLRHHEYAAAWFLVYRDITRATDARTAIAAAIPRTAASRNSPVLGVRNRLAPGFLLATLNGFVLDFVARQSVGGIHLTFGVLKQLAVPSPNLVLAWSNENVPGGCGWFDLRILELSFTSWDVSALGPEFGYRGPPFKWNVDRRVLIRAELDAAFFHLYGIERDDVDYIMDLFPIVRRKDEAAHGEYRTKRLILERYDALAEAISSGTEYETVLDPPPADPRIAHPESSRPSWA